MAKRDESLRLIEAERARLRDEIAGLGGQLAGVERAIEILRGSTAAAPARLALPAPAAASPRRRRGGRRKPETGDEIARLRRLWADPALSVAAIARQLKWSWITVKTTAAQLGLPERPSQRGRRAAPPAIKPAAEPPPAKAAKLPPGTRRCADCTRVFRPAAPDDDICNACRKG